MFRTIFLVIVATSSLTVVSSQDSKKTRDSLKTVSVTNMVTAKNYVFEAQSASPMKGSRRNLSAGYTLEISKDTVISDLPYYGRAYSADYGSSEGGIKFTSTDFEYTIGEMKKGGWEIILKPRDYKKVQQMRLTIFDNGSASLQANFTDKQPISFNGYIEERKPKK